MWFIGVGVEQETTAPLAKKILDPPLFMLSQVLQMLILKYYFHARDKKCPTATLSGQDEANLAF